MLVQSLLTAGETAALILAPATGCSKTGTAILDLMVGFIVREWGGVLDRD